MFTGIWRDLTHAARALARARAFTLVCVISLGVGMAPVIAVPYGTRILSQPPLGIDTTSLVEVVTTRNGPHAPANSWSYPNFADLRNANTGLTVFGWSGGQSRLATATASSQPNDPVSTMF